MSTLLERLQKSDLLKPPHVKSFSEFTCEVCKRTGDDSLFSYYRKKDGKGICRDCIRKDVVVTFVDYNQDYILSEEENSSYALGSEKKFFCENCDDILPESEFDNIKDYGSICMGLCKRCKTKLKRIFKNENAILLEAWGIM